MADDQGVRPRIGRRRDQRAKGLRAAIVLVGADDEAAFGDIQARLRFLAGDQARRLDGALEAARVRLPVGTPVALNTSPTARACARP